VGAQPSIAQKQIPLHSSHAFEVQPALVPAEQPEDTAAIQVQLEYSGGGWKSPLMERVLRV